MERLRIEKLITKTLAGIDRIQSSFEFYSYDSAKRSELLRRERLATSYLQHLEARKKTLIQIEMIKTYLRKEGKCPKRITDLTVLGFPVLEVEDMEPGILILCPAPKFEIDPDTGEIYFKKPDPKGVGKIILK